MNLFASSRRQQRLERGPCHRDLHHRKDYEYHSENRQSGIKAPYALSIFSVAGAGCVHTNAEPADRLHCCASSRPEGSTNFERQLFVAQLCDRIFRHQDAPVIAPTKKPRPKPGLKFYCPITLGASAPSCRRRAGRASCQHWYISKDVFIRSAQKTKLGPEIIWENLMPNTDRYVFNHKQLLEALVKHASIHEGKWTLRANFGCIPGNFGPSAEKTSPGLAIALIDVGIVSAALDHPESMVIDAAIVNPAPRRMIKSANGRMSRHLN
jgi:hypothetical protein